jgi:hypothetical protein
MLFTDFKRVLILFVIICWRLEVEALRQTFDERLQEIETYLELLESIEQQVRAGPPRLGTHGPLITTDQQKILYSSVYLQLYNLVEATITRCLDAVCEAATNGWYPSDLSIHFQREWVRFIARTHVELNHENRLKHALDLFGELVPAAPISKLKVERAGGNWDDDEIKGITDRIGLSLRISRPVYEGIKRPIRDDKGPLVLIKALRNELAHGTISFVECGDGVTVADLRDLKNKTALYLSEVVASFANAISSCEFLTKARRPMEAPA